MPPAVPVAGIPRIGVVITKLVVAGEDRGIRLFFGGTWRWKRDV